MRTMLFVPGDKERLLLKSLGLGADAVIWDLEDAVAFGAKESARSTVANALQNARVTDVPVYVRVNSSSAQMLDADLECVVRPGIQGIVFPKAESPTQVKALDSALTRLETANGIPQGTVKVWCLLETCLGVLHAHAIAAAGSRVIGACFGAEDFTLDLGVARTREGRELAHARAAIGIAAAAARVSAIDTVFSDLNDLEGLINECRLARQLGYTGKLAIHPKQLEIINREFSPSQSELAAAEKIVEAYTAAEKNNLGVVTLEGKMIDAPVVERARRLLGLKARR